MAGVGELEFTYVGGPLDGGTDGQFKLGIVASSIKNGALSPPIQGERYTILRKPYRQEFRWLLVHPNALRLYVEDST